MAECSASLWDISKPVVRSCDVVRDQFEIEFDNVFLEIR